MKNSFYFIFCSEDNRLSKDRRVVHGVTMSGNEWYNEWQRMTTSDNEWRVVQRVTTSGTTGDNKWQRVTTNGKEQQQMTRNDNE